MRLITVGAAVLNQTPLDWAGNAERIVTALRAARHAGVGVVCLPELCVTGYGCEDAFMSPDVQATAIDVLVRDLVPQTTGLIACFGLPVMYQNALFNGAALACDGALLGIVCKQHLAGDGLHYEPRWFRAWEPGVRGTVAIGDKRVPIGDIHFECSGVRVGFEICEDAWVANRPGAPLAQRGVDVMLNPSARHFAFGKLAVRKRLVIEGSRAFGVTYIYTNLVGNEAGRAIYDGGALIASGGALVAAGERFGFEATGLTTAVVDVDATRMAQSRTASFRPDMDGDESDCVRASFEWPPAEATAAAVATAAWERSDRLKCEEFTRAIALGLHDYRRKSHTQGFVVSLSGGADSTACAVLAALSLRMAGDEVGERVTCVYQKTAQSSQTTLDAATTVAAAVGAEFLLFDVDALVGMYTAMVSSALGRELAWDTDDIALQNIQARARGPGVWMVANLKGQLLLATSNRSEAAVGYATMDGDTCGGLSPIGGIDKAFLLEWLRWMELEGPVGWGPMAELACVTALKPTAELRPQEFEQTDESDLMPYPVLDAIEELAIGQKHGPVSAFRLLRTRFADVAEGQLAAWVTRFFRLWCRNQWKRERYAPAFHVDDLNLDPKTWCRFPILSGGFERELAELKAMVP